jgi:hypothetical protein
MKSSKSVLAQLMRNFAFLLTSLGRTGAHAQGADETVWPTRIGRHPRPKSKA